MFYHFYVWYSSDYFANDLGKPYLRGLFQFLEEVEEFPTNIIAGGKSSLWDCALDTYYIPSNCCITDVKIRVPSINKDNCEFVVCFCE